MNKKETGSERKSVNFNPVTTRATGKKINEVFQDLKLNSDEEEQMNLAKNKAWLKSNTNRERDLVSILKYPATNKENLRDKNGREIVEYAPRIIKKKEKLDRWITEITEDGKMYEEFMFL